VLAGLTTSLAPPIPSVDDVLGDRQRQVAAGDGVADRGDRAAVGDPEVVDQRAVRSTARRADAGRRRDDAADRARRRRRAREGTERLSEPAISAAPIRQCWSASRRKPGHASVCRTSPGTIVRRR
jgi:hypothetical protein